MPSGVRVIINYSDLIEEMDLTKRQAENLHKFVSTRMAKGYASTLKKVAQSELKKFKSDYVSSITVDNGLVYLQGDLANRIEEGSEPFDIKAGNFKSKKTSKNGGWYVDIPFRHSSPRSLGKGLGFSSAIPKAVYSALQNKIKEGGNPRLYRKDLPDQNKNVVTKKGLTAPYVHKSPIYEGLIRTGGSFQRKYFTFRRISNNSDPNSWIHPGFKSKNLMDKALSLFNTDEEADKLIEEFFQK